MSYPGNLFALVARDRHLKSYTNSVMEIKMGHHEDHQDHQDYRDRQGSGGTRPRLRGKRGRRSSQASKLSTEDSFATSGGKPKSNAHALRALSRELQSSYQARGATGWKQWAMPPSEYGDRTAINSSMDTRGSTDMDAPRGTDEAPGYHSEDKAFESDATSASETRLRGGELTAQIELPSTERALRDQRLHGGNVSPGEGQSIKRAICTVDGVVQPQSASSCSYKTCSVGGGSDTLARSARAVDSKAIDNTFSGGMETLRGVGWLESYSTGQAKHFGIPLMPRNHFRAAMTLRARTKEARSVNATPSSKLLTESKDMPGGGQNRGRLVGARAAAAKSSLLRYTIRWQEIAMLHRVLEAGSNRRPAGETLERVGRALKDIACESSSPGILSRAQFVSTLSRTLESCHSEALHRMYSSFDPDGTDRVRYVDILACLWITHKPEAEALLEGLQQTFLGNLGALDPELQAELTKGGRQVAWRFLRRMFKLFDRAGEGLGVTVVDTERLFQVCATSDQDILQMSSTFTTYMQDHCSTTASTKQILTEGLFERHFCMAWPLLDLFEIQMTVCQAIVKRTLHAK